MGAPRAQIITEDRASGAQVIDSSLIFNPGVNNHLKRTISTAGNGRIFTLSAWVKHDSTDSNDRILGNYTDGNNYASFYFRDTPDYQISFVEKVSSAYPVNCHSTMMARDPSSWYHVVWAIDTSQGTAANRVKLYVNGIQETVTGPYSNGASTGAATFPTENYDTRLTGGDAPASFYVGDYGNNANWDGNMSQVYFIDGQALDASYFGYTDPLTNTWRPKKYTGSYNITPGGDEIVSGATLLTWDDSPIGSVYTLSNSDKTATTNDGGTGYANADVWSIAIAANTTYAWTLDITNGDSTGGWYFTDSQTASGTHADERGGNSCGLRGGETSMGTHGTFATANGTSSGQSQISVNSAVSPNGTKKIDFVVYRPSSGDGKVWIRGYGASSWLGGGDPTNTSSTATFAIPDGTTYFGMTAYSRGTAQVLTFDELVTGPTGVNSFYLPLDGSGPIGRDQSPNANDWTPKNFGGSVPPDKATGAQPILNTINGGKVSVPGVRGEAGIAVTVYNSKYYLDGAEAGTVSFVPGQNITFDTSNSTVSGHPFRLSGIADGSHNTLYSVDFDGSGDYLTIANSSDYSFGSGDFTVECWAYFDDVSEYESLVGMWKASSGYSWLIQTYPDNKISAFLSTSGSGITSTLTSSSTITTGQWYHIALVVSSSNAKLYIDGLETASASSIGTLYNNTSDGLTIGGSQDSGTELLDGKISDLRIVKGTAVYTSNFSPPAVSLTNITNTKLLCCNQSTTTGYTVSSGTITANGDPTSSGDSPYDTYSFGTVTGASEGSAGAATTITIPNNAPSNLYYYCTNHSGMGGAISIGAIDSSVADPYAWKCVLALPLVDSSDVSNRVNSGSATKTATVTAATSSSDQSNFYGRSYKFDGTTNASHSATNYILVADSGNQFAFGTGDFTIECWVWANNWSTGDQVFLGHTGTNYSGFYISSAAYCYYADGSSHFIPSSNKPTLQNKKWFHAAVSRQSGTTRVFLDGILIGSDTDTDSHPTGSIEIGRNPGNAKNQFNGYIQDVRVYKGTSKYTSNFIPASTNPDILPETPSGVAYSSELTKPTDGAVSFGQEEGYLTVAENADWDFGTGDYTAEAWVYMTGTDNYVFATLISGSWWGLNFWTNNSSWSVRAGYNSKHEFSKRWNYRQWYHVAVARESGTSRLFLDGELIDTQSDSDNLDSTGDLQVGRDANSWNKKFGGLISNARIVKGTAVYTSNFTPSSTPLTNITNTKLLCCQSNSSAVNYAVSPGAITANGDAVASNFNPFDDDIDIVRGKPTGYCTANPLDKGALDLSNGNLRVERTSDTTNWETGRCTMKIPDTGKWYWEMTLHSGSNDGIYTGVGLASADLSQEITSFWAYNSAGYAIYNTTYAGSLTAMSVGDTACVSFDRDNNRLWVLINAIKSIYGGNPNSGVDPNSNWTNIPSDVYPAVGARYTGVGDFNFGQKPFKFPPPEGFLPLCTANLPSPGLTTPDQYFTTVLYSGDNAANHPIITKFRPDLVILKVRTAADKSVWCDSIRGAGALLYSSQTGAQETGGTYEARFPSLDNSGFTVGTSDQGINSDSNTYASWSWKAGGNKGTFNKDGTGFATAATAGITQGSIDITAASINTQSKFSIVKYTTTGSNGTVSHGLDTAPAFMIGKNYDSSTDWIIYHQSIGNTGRLKFTNGTTSTHSTFWQDTSPTDTVFSIGTSGDVNNSSNDGMIFYCWADVPGVQKFGFYKGKASTSAPLVFTGFRPAVIWVKGADEDKNWVVWDNKLNPYNPTSTYLLFPSADNAEASGLNIDILSNGFMLRNGGNEINNGGKTYIYCAWADQPYHNLYGCQSNAR